VVTTDKELTLAQEPKGTVSVGLENIRTFSGHYRSADDFDRLNEHQKEDLTTKGQNPSDPTNLRGPDSIQAGGDPVELQVFTTMNSGENSATSARIPWGAIPGEDATSVLAPSSGVYVLNLDKKKPDLDPVPAPADVEEAEDVGETVVESDDDECLGEDGKTVRGSKDAKAGEQPDSQRVFGRNPLDRMTVTSDYGCRTHPTTGKKDFHAGIDLEAAEGTPIYAVANGRMGVRNTGARQANLGLIALLITDTGENIWYGHLSRVDVEGGARVVKGQQLGLTGSSGRATGPHLHLITAAKVGGSVKNVNPRWYFQSLSNPSGGNS
jgi:murein DD-endopeptidase MepM/ murein hydrolase activator NlpD